jgi:hypothetical protein
MIPSWIIEEIRRQEREKEVGIPLYIDIEPPQDRPIHEESPEDSERGVCIIEF